MLSYGHFAAFPVLLAIVLGGLVGGVARWWIGVLRRGAVVPLGWVEVPLAALSGLTILLTPPESWGLALWVALLTVVLSVIDIRHHRLPDAITLPAIPLTLVVVALTELLSPQQGGWWRAVIGGAVLGTLFLLLARYVPAAMGRGDAKLAFSIGIALAYLSWVGVLVGVFIAFVLGSLLGVAGVVSRRMTMKSALPFGPCLLIGCWLVIVMPTLAGPIHGTSF